MATSSWRLEDLQQLEELGLAGQLESTRLQEEGAGAECEGQERGRGHRPEEEQDWYTMSAVLSDLLMTEAPPTPSILPQPPAPSVAMETILQAPTAYGVKHGSSVVTYINRGQWYEVRLQPLVQDALKEGALYKCVLSLGFSELRMRNSEHELLEVWGQDHPCERLLDIDRRGCGGVSHVQETASLNSISFLWQPLQQGIVSLKINCLSSEFAAKKHGGERGILLQISMDTYSVSPEGGEHHLQRAACNVKVFKDKGGDRKQKQDQQKMEKLLPAELAVYLPSLEATPFVPTLSGSQSLPLVSPSPLSSSSPLPSRSALSPQPGPSLLHSSSISPLVARLSPGTATNHNVDLGVMSSIEETHQWLASHHFSAYLSVFASYSGADLLRLSRRDLVELCGPGDGIRLFNTLRSRSLRTLYVCLDDKTVFQAVCLEQLTAHELQSKLSEKVGLQACQVSCVLQLTGSGILVMVDDTVVQNLCDEDSFLLSAVKEETTGTHRLLLRSHTHNTTLLGQSTPCKPSLSGRIPRADLH